MTRPVRAILALLVALSVAGCFESAEERAVSAYHAGDYATALRLAEGLAAEGSARGYEILALAAAEGLGGRADYDAAMRWAAAAAAADPSFGELRQAIRGKVTFAEQSARRAFERGQFDRAAALAEPLAEFGSATGRDLLEQLLTGHFVTLPGSEMTWRRFWNHCTGNLRREDAGADEAAFEADCLGRRVVWEGWMVGRRDDTVLIRMDPGRGRVRQDLAVILADPEADTADVEGKVRFAGTIAARGDADRPDRLGDGALLGPGTLSRFEAARIDLETRRRVDAVCVKLIERHFDAYHTPDWIAEIVAERRAAGRRNTFYTTVETDTAADIYERQADGSWRGRLAGRVSVLDYVLQKAWLEGFVAECRVVAGFESMTDRSEMGELLSFTVLGGEMVAQGAAGDARPPRGD